MSKLQQKRRRVSIVILATATGNILVIAIPLSNIEQKKYLLSTFANVMMFIIIWESYFNEQLLQKSIKQILQDLLSITLISTITSLVIFKGITKAIDYLIMYFGSYGWSIAGAIAGFVTAILGVAWSSYCEDFYRNSK